MTPDQGRIWMYLVTLAVSLVLLFAALGIGKFVVERQVLLPPNSELALSSAEGITAVNGIGVQTDSHKMLSLFLLQVIVIVMTARICGFLSGLVGQPRVIGEIIAGIVLGPSVLGFFWPASNVYLFPQDSLSALFLFSQLGLIFFMFMVGMEMNIKSIQASSYQVIFISHMSVALPFILGVILAIMIFMDYAPANVGFTSFALFIGIAMSITAFPVLARILRDRRLSHTPIGNIALACAAVDDVTAWCLLALIIVVAKSGTLTEALQLLVLVVLFIGLMIGVVRPLWRRLIAITAKDGTLNQTTMVITMLIVLGTAVSAELVGLHGLFGAFLAGAVMPKKETLSEPISERIEDLSTLVLLPFFFAYVGIRTEIGLLNDAASWLICGLIVITAVTGKLAGSALAARSTGMSWQDSLSVGTLMNTRGLMELVVLNIGYELGILSDKLFAMMVIMALLTTLMTGPLLNIIERWPQNKQISR